MRRARRNGAGWLLAVVVVLTASHALAQETDRAGEDAMFARINELRTAAHVAPLERSAQLDQAARTQSADMAWNQYLDHVSERTGDPGARVEAAGFEADEVGENVALRRQVSAAQAALERSEPHMANMVNAQFTHVGISAVRGERGYYVTQVFARPEDAAPVTPPVAAASPTSASGAAVGGVAGALGAAVGASTLGGVAALGAGPSSAGSEAASAGTAGLSAAVPAASGLAASGLTASAGARVPEAPASVVQPGGAQQATSIPGPSPSGAAQGQAAAAPTAQPQAQSQSGGRVAGYWLYSGNRWWYYPVPAGARPGQQLVADPRYMGGPNGDGRPPVGAPGAANGWSWSGPGTRWSTGGTYQPGWTQPYPYAQPYGYPQAQPYYYPVR